VIHNGQVTNDAAMHNIRSVQAGNLEIAYETFGDRSDPAVLLVMGLGTQMLAWPDEFCEGLAAAGRYVVRFDNRDCGLSTHFDALPAPLPGKVLLGRARAPYSIDDMAGDTLALMDALGLDRVDLVGASMGGFIAQAIALRSPQRLRSLTLMMTSTGSRLVGYPHPKVAPQLLKRRSVADRDSAIHTAATIFRTIGSPGYAFDEDYLQNLAGRSYDRAYDPKGYLRQLAACLTQPDRTAGLKALDVPTLVIHGLHDPLVSATGGLALAKVIKGAKFVGFSGMGHDLPRALWPQLTSEVLAIGEAGRVALATG
jgi:pimeloyl-ACP methyl ester carboxylesterase